MKNTARPSLSVWKRLDFWLIGGLLVVGGICLALQLGFQRIASREPSRYAQIYQDGKLVLSVDLLQAEDQILALPDSGVKFQIKQGKIGFFDADCPDKICEEAGLIGTPSQRAVCLPRKTTVAIVSSDQDEDVPDLIVQ